MKRGYRRKGKERAFLRFFIGLFFLIILVALGYWLIGVMDYSSQLEQPDDTLRTYVLAEGADPIPLPTPTIEPVSTEAPVSTPDAAASTDAPTIGVGTSASPLVVETPTPEPTPEPEPTPDPTPIPDNAARAGEQRATLPTMGENGVLGITKCYVSVPNEYHVMEINGYCYVDSAGFDGSNSGTYLVVAMETDKGYTYMVYPAEHVSGISGIDHQATCANPGAADFRVFIDVSKDKYPDGVYTLGIVMGYNDNGQAKFDYFSFSDTTTTFTVLNGQVVKVVPVSGASDTDVG